MSRSLTFNAAVTSQMVEVRIIDDYIVEHSEIINLTLVSADSAVILNPSTSTITIEDVNSKLLYIDHWPVGRGGSLGHLLLTSKRFYIHRVTVHFMCRIS